MKSVFYLCIFAFAIGSPTKRAKRSSQNEFQINQGICPPVLCPNIAAGIADGSVDPSQGEIVRSSATLLFAAPPRLQAVQSFESPFFEGDIVLDNPLGARLQAARMRQSPNRRRRDTETTESKQQIRSRSQRSIVRPISRLWRYGIVPYAFDSSISYSTRNLIEKALEGLMNKTCIKFKPHENEDDYLFYINQPGCWSYVGRKGGQQLISIGRGCERKGTIMHETGHALGFWHEQSRPDRDKYIQVLEANLSPRLLDQFEKREDSESTSRGYAYDYESIMHYGKDYFSINGKNTLKIIGPGRHKKLKIGQRKKLSDLDLAGLNAMYYCNNKAREEYAKQLICESGWIKYKSNCYQFNNQVVENFGGANRFCGRENADLVHINNEGEDKFIKNHLISNYRDHKTWRTGGSEVRGKFVWYNSKGSDHVKMRYKKWSPNHPGGKKTLGLELFETGQPQRFVWRGIEAGSKAQLPDYAYAFICERPAKPRGNKCLPLNKALKGQDYRGRINYTAQNVTCMRWSDQYPHKHSTFTQNKYIDEKQNGLGRHNYCRNPNGARRRPWCYTLQTKVKWQYCDIKICK